MASEETDVQHPGVDRFSLDDFRLRLDSPLFHRDPGLPSGPVSRELSWERTPEPVTIEPRPVAAPAAAPAPAPTDASEFSAKLLQASAMPAMPRLPSFSEMIAAPAEPEPEAELEPEPAYVPESDVQAAPVAEDHEFGEAALTLLRTDPNVTPARHPDTFVNDLAELIMRASGPAAAPAPAPVAPAEAPSVHVQAELNRLAFLPDREDAPQRVEVPAIVVADPMPIPTVAVVPPTEVPNLSQHEMFLPRVAIQPPPRRNYADIVASMAPATRRRKRHPVRKLFATVVLLGLVGGGLFAAKYYFFDQRWDADVKPMVAEVEQARGLSFDHAVKVTTLPGSEYAVKLVNSTFGIDADNQATFAGGWRALGLLSGGFDPNGLGMAGVADSPAFYDPASETIYVLADLPPDLRWFALERALTLALLDQEYGWSGRVAGQSPSVAHGTRALYDADALAVATSLLTDTERASVLVQQSALYTAYPVGASAAPYVTSLATRSGLALRAYFDGSSLATRDAIERDAAVSDAAALDLRWLLTPPATAPSAQSQGMLFWYHVLASRVGNDTAWRAALGWRDDSVSFVQGDRTCVTAVVQIDPGSYDLAASAFQAWAAAAPAASGTVVAAAGAAVGQITVTACDPGETVATNDGRVRLTLGGAPLRSEQFHRLVTTYPQLSPVQLACVVFAGDAVSTGDERGVVDPVAGWAAPNAHPAPDPNQPGCSQP